MIVRIVLLTLIGLACGTVAVRATLQPEASTPITADPTDSEAGAPQVGGQMSSPRRTAESTEPFRLDAATTRRLRLVVESGETSALASADLQELLRDAQQAEPLTSDRRDLELVCHAVLVRGLIESWNDESRTTLDARNVVLEDGATIDLVDVTTAGGQLTGRTASGITVKLPTGRLDRLGSRDVGPIRQQLDRSPLGALEPSERAFGDLGSSEQSVLLELEARNALDSEDTTRVRVSFAKWLDSNGPVDLARRRRDRTPNLTTAVELLGARPFPRLTVRDETTGVLQDATEVDADGADASEAIVALDLDGIESELRRARSELLKDADSELQSRWARRALDWVQELEAMERTGLDVRGRKVRSAGVRELLQRVQIFRVDLSKRTGF